MSVKTFLNRLKFLPPANRAVELLLREYFKDDGFGIEDATLLAEKFKLNLSPDTTTELQIGETRWNKDEEVPETRCNETILQHGLETLYHAQNDTGADLDPGVPVMFAEAIGASGRGRMEPADLSDPANVPLYLGPVTETILDGGVGKITEFGRNRGINCSGSGAGKLSFAEETWLNGDSVWVDPDNPGYLTNIPPASPKAKLRAGFVLNNHPVVGTLFVISNHQDEQTAWGDRLNGNYAEIESDGTLRFAGDATTFVDVDFTMNPRTAVANQPTPTTMIGNLVSPRWAVDDYFNSSAEEFMHKWKEGSEVFWHIHMWQVVDATDSYVNWEIEFTWANSLIAGDPVPAPVTITSGDFLVPGGSGLKLFAVPIGSFTPTGGKIAGHVKARLKRVASSGTAPTTNPFVDKMQMHIECDTVGSRLEFTK